ncbi:C-GCAxxG-C-C family protein [Ancylomarina sp. 16SWW S1-10-2]|uniref:C-GCAxxG-C-C family protein n=1 Tax=Ancylomarina sp. 16SWW S1-10-2 TaxID=2499681 RepID=UPI0012AE5FA7|nr:C-GCAxxG-C-C family protein [Ancylomarina sp. 16SWW S1-10-2]MRT94361.1 C_GCAxxG_C_C family protein [Ancylomarina sp. 16SWW S1-10-2]
MKEIEEKALYSFYNGMNCAQSVLTAYADYLDFDPKLALHVTNGFGSGMGKLQKTCGVVTGSFMAMGIYNGAKHADNMVARSETNKMIKQFTHDFKTLHGSLDCKSLLNCDFSTEQGNKQFVDMDLKKKVCSKCISSSIKIVEAIIGNK